MKYRVTVTLTAQKEIMKKTDKGIVDRLDKKIMKLSIEPHTYGKPLRRPLEGIWEFRFEKRWRVLYTIDEIAKTVTIIGIKHKDEF